MTTLVEPVLGPVLPTSADSAVASRDGSSYDFAIGGLFFNTQPGDTTPYERATAQFRKDQLDTSQTPGDQSLVGYWQRGQLSFHNGSGVKFYEVEEDESGTVLNRFRSSLGVDPFTPGQVTCAPAWADQFTFTPGTMLWSGVNGTDLVTLTGGQILYGPLGGNFTTYAPAAGATVVAATAGGGAIYTADSGKNIVRVPNATTLYTSPNAVTGIFYAKDRLFVVDDTNTWYQLSPNPTGTLPVAIAGTDKVFSVNTTSPWCVTDTPGPVLFGNGNRVFAVTVDATTGDIPSLSGPVQVADLPDNETITALGYQLGFLTIVTTAGVRIAALADSGSVTYGPLLVEWDDAATHTSLARHGSRVAVTGGHGIYEVDLSRQVGNGLEFAWAQLDSPLSTQTNYGVTAVGGKLVVWGDGLTKYQTTDLASGTLTTGFHRFGTLDPKKFQSVSVRVGGAGGTVAVAKVMSDDSTVNIYTIDVSQSDGATLTLSLGEPSEMIGLKFTLTPDGDDATVGPQLLGYVLKALPAPRRQRMIQVPVLMYDHETRRPAPMTGHRGGAWSRLSALEDMESSGGTFIFQDFRTGESGECFIESIDFLCKTPPSANDTGYGGVATLTLRKL